jgi:hypothetical protein
MNDAVECCGDAVMTKNRSMMVVVVICAFFQRLLIN